MEKKSWRRVYGIGGILVIYFDLFCSFDEEIGKPLQKFLGLKRQHEKMSSFEYVQLILFHVRFLGGMHCIRVYSTGTFYSNRFTLWPGR